MDETTIRTIQWFDSSPDAGTPECICSLCGQPITDSVIVRLFDADAPDGGQEARFDRQCAHLVIYTPQLPPVYNVYLPPVMLPLYWRNEATGELPAAIKAFIWYMANQKDKPPPTDDQIAMIVQYCAYFIFAPCWDESGFAKEMLQLRYEIRFVKTIDQLAAWLYKAREIALDPF